MQSLTNKIFLVTGATSGFGHAIAEAAVAAGARVIATGRRRERLSDLVEKHDGQIFPLAFDVQKHDAVETAIASLPANWKDVDVLVNNAGLALNTETADKVPFSDWETMIDTNVKGLLYVTRAVMPAMLARNQGHIITMGSISGRYPYKGGNVYGGTKAFVRQFALNLRTDLLGTKIRVTNVEPGMAETEFSLVRLKGDAGKAKDVYQGVAPLRGEDIASAVIWCAAQPEHVNVNTIEIMPTCQAAGGLAVARNS